jgi:hypothetical protein
VLKEGVRDIFAIFDYKPPPLKKQILSLNNPKIRNKVIHFVVYESFFKLTDKKV